MLFINPLSSYLMRPFTEDEENKNYSENDKITVNQNTFDKCCYIIDKKLEKVDAL